MKGKSLNFCIKALAASIPANCEHNENLTIFNEGEKRLSLKTLGIRKRHIEILGRRASFFALDAAERIFAAQPKAREAISCLIYITQTPDFITPATSIWLQNKLGLGQHCLCFDVNLGCSGFVNGLLLAEAILTQQGGGMALLLTSDISSALIKEGDTSTQPIFSDGGSATLIEQSSNTPNSYGLFGNDGKGYQAIFKDHPLWNPYPDYLKMQGLDILNFTLKTVNENISACMQDAGESIESIDYFLLHQAGQLINEGIRKKLEIPKDKYLYSLQEYGNTSSSSIPITMIHNAENFSSVEAQRVLMCGFGVGLSWGTIITQIQDCLFLGIVEV